MGVLVGRGIKIAKKKDFFFGGVCWRRGRREVIHYSGSRLKVSSSLQSMDSFPDFFCFDRDSLDALVWSSKTYLLIFDLFGLGYSVFTFHFYWFFSSRSVWYCFSLFVSCLQSCFDFYLKYVWFQFEICLILFIWNVFDFTHQFKPVDSEHETWLFLVSFVYFLHALFLDTFPCFWCCLCMVTLLDIVMRGMEWCWFMSSWKTGLWETIYTNWNEDCTMSIPWSQLSWEVWPKIRCTMVSMFMWRIWRCQQRKINWRELIHPRKWMNPKEIDLSWVFNPLPGYGELIGYLRTLLSVLSPFAECPPAHPSIMKRCREFQWLEITCFKTGRFCHYCQILLVSEAPTFEDCLEDWLISNNWSHANVVMRRVFNASII